MNDITAIIARNRAGEAVAIPSICTAHPDALLATLLLVREFDWPVLIEATSNQVNQHGGYTGMLPADFRAMVLDLCERAGVPPERITFGGDHLGPQVWRNQSADLAMAEAVTLVRTYVEAGFRKIHLDCSEGCAGEPQQVGDSIAAERAARLAQTCEIAAGEDAGSLLYVIGTEVPPPGGGRGDGHNLVPTAPNAARATIEAHHKAFEAEGLQHVMSRVIGLVVQPGVDFEPDHIHHLPDEGGEALRNVLEAHPKLCFEAHSTDYQKPDAYPRLARSGFAIQKVGPALTHAYRRAIYAMADLERETNGRDTLDVRETMEQLMLANPRWWAGHYHGSPESQRHLRHHSFSDRIRYYWPQPEATSAVSGLYGRLASTTMPGATLERHFSLETLRRAENLRSLNGISQAKSLVLAEIQTALAPYFFSAGANSNA